MANSEFKTAAAQLLDQQGVKNVAAKAMQAESVKNAGNGMQPAVQSYDSMGMLPQIKTSSTSEQSAQHLVRKAITVPLLISLAKTPLSLGLAVLCCALMLLFVPTTIFTKAFNAVLGIIIGLTYGIILAFPHREKAGINHEQE